MLGLRTGLDQLRRRVAVVALVAACLACGCSDPKRPSVTEWESKWRDVRSHLPMHDAIVAAPDPRKMCSDALAFIRDAERQLFPAPDDVIEVTARKWIKIVLGAYMQCDAHGRHPDLDHAFERAAVVERELDAAIGAAKR